MPKSYWYKYKVSLKDSAEWGILCVKLCNNWHIKINKDDEWFLTYAHSKTKALSSSDKGFSHSFVHVENGIIS